ncbi:phosphoenolpyruvate synthase-related [Holotrichia oblita]|nr:phosphoenolpyruvate synthase-related [Holotrichia oblita]
MRIYTLNNLPYEEYSKCGGKARGLSQLFEAKLNVAKGFVVMDLQTDEDYEECADYYVNGKYKNVAVRSSATSEDGEDFSSAGQYSTFLNVEGKENFIDALRLCIKSLCSVTASTYSQFFAMNKKTNSMNIVVQEMVEAVYAGVCFTSDPVTNEKTILIEAVEGLGESLVSGEAKGERYLVPYERRDGDIVLGNIEAEGGMLSNEYVSKIANDVVAAQKFFDRELDLEWAIGRGGELVWLQARPITTLDDATVDEFDPLVADDAVITNCNIGEMLPSAVTPLSLSTSVKSIDIGLRKMLMAAGAYTKKEMAKQNCIISFSNHLFFNLTSIYKMAVSIVGAQKADVEASICGKHLDTPPIPFKKKAGIVRLINGTKYIKFLFSRKKAMKKADKLAENLVIEEADDLLQFYKNIDAKIAVMDKVTALHYVTSSFSGAMSSTLLTILTKKYESESEARTVLAGLLEDIDNIESVDILRSMRVLAKAALDKNPGSVNFTCEELAAFIKADTSFVKFAYDCFIARHGHRGIREAELRSLSWKNDEKLLMENVLLVMKTGAVEPPKTASNFRACYEKEMHGKKGLAKKGMGYLINQARTGVYNREYTKSKMIKAVDCFKTAYIKLAERMVEVGALPDKDLIYFLTHKEIGELIEHKKAKLIKRAIQRRRLIEQQRELKFKDVNIGKPQPIIIEKISAQNGMELYGAPISRGEVKGRARTVRSVDDARELKDGEIMIAAFTDIGWSPYYSVIGGLVTEVGSALSHGAVVAREYALPLVVNVANATNIIKTGDLIYLNGNKGIVTVLETAESAAK